MHDVPPIPLAPLSRRVRRIAREPAHADGEIDRPRRRVGLVLPVVARRGSPRVGKPVQHYRVEHLVFAEYALHIASVVGPVAELLVDPGSLSDGGVGECVADGLGSGGLLEGVATISGGVAAVVEGHCEGFALLVLGWGLDFFLRESA